MSDNPLGLWGVSMGDQISAAVEADDWPLVARLGVDGYLHTVKMSRAEGATVDFQYIAASLLNMRAENVLLFAAEALRRLADEADRDA